MDDQVKKFIDEGYRRFPDVVEPIQEHPAGKITVNRGDLRYAFLEGALYAAMQARAEQHQRVWTGPGYLEQTGYIDK